MLSQHRRIMFGLAVFLTVLSAAPERSRAEAPAVRKIADLVYITRGELPLHLDLYLPDEPQNGRPLVMYIHGGSWRAGSRKGCPLTWLAEAGYPVASIDYRLSQQAVFPAQLHDCQAAVRWLRANSAKYGYEATQVVAAGASAGGHLAALLGVSDGVEDLVEESAELADRSARVQAIVDYYGTTDFLFRSKAQPRNTEQPEGNVYQLLGGAVSSNIPLAKLASSVTHVSEDDPPLLMVHGLLDRQVNVQQSVQLYQRYRAMKLPATIRLVEDAGHGGDVFYSPENRQVVLDFLKGVFAR